jgi:ribosome assembly protein 4
MEYATLKGVLDEVWSVAYSPDGKTLASGSKEIGVCLWDMGTHMKKATLRGHTGYVWCVAYSPDGKTLASGSVDNTIKLWAKVSARPPVAWACASATSPVAPCWKS